MTQEIWKPIPGFKGYEASNTGKVRSYYKPIGIGGKWDISKEPQRELKQSTRDDGYKFVHLRSNGKGFTLRVHQLVMLAFIGHCPDKKECCHNDGNKENNSIDNLRYDTRQANLIDASIHNAILSEETVNFIRKNIASGDSVSDVAKAIKLDREFVKNIAVGKTHKHVGIKPLKCIPRKSSYDFYRARSIRASYANGNITLRRLAEIYKIDQSAVSLIVNGKRLTDAGGPIKGQDY